MIDMKTLGPGLIMMALMFGGCSGNRGASDKAGTGGTSEPNTKESSGSQAGHAAHGPGPNGGVVFDLGKYHAEFTVDHPNEQCTILVLGTDEKMPTAVAAQDLTLITKETKTSDGTAVAPMTIKLMPQDETDGKASKFLGTDPGLGNVADFEGTVIGQIDGKPSQGEFSEKDGAAGHSHSHSHGADDALVWEGKPQCQRPQDGHQLQQRRHSHH